MGKEEDNVQPPNDANNHSSHGLPSWETERCHVTSFEQLSPGSIKPFLTMVGCLFGFRLDNYTGPVMSHQQGAEFREGKSAILREAVVVHTENVISENERESNYAHSGWPLDALSSASPWTQARLSMESQPNRSGKFVTKRVVVTRLCIRLFCEDIYPAPEFSQEIEAALKKSNRTDKLQAVYRVLERWGDVVPLEFDVGCSLAVTDLESNMDKEPTYMLHRQIVQLVAHKTAKISMQAINLQDMTSNLGDWLSGHGIPIGKWQVVKVTKAVPILALLDPGLQTKLSVLYNSLVSYRPLSIDKGASGGYVFDDIEHAFKTIRSVTINCDDRVYSFSVGYSDGTCSKKHGSDKGISSTFNLIPGEHISEILAWNSSEHLCGLQFMTTFGRLSQCYGSGSAPDVLSGEGGCLAALAGRFKDGFLYRIQGIWRHDIRHAGFGEERAYSQYYGGDWGYRFNDLSLSLHPCSKISKINIWSGSRVDGIQFIYSYLEGDHAVILEGPRHGGTKGTASKFELSSEEHVVRIRGRIDGNVTQLCFITNQGRVSDVFGEGTGTVFVSHAPLSKSGKAMRLFSVCGGSGTMLDGLLFVWSPV